MATVLIVDDEPLLNDSLARFFANQGHRVLQGRTGNEGLAHLAQGPIDIVVSDVRMPEGSGMDVLRAALQGPHPKPAVFFFMSGHSDMTDAEAKRLGADGVIAKPFSKRELVEHVMGQFKIKSGV